MPGKNEKPLTDDYAERSEINKDENSKNLNTLRSLLVEAGYGNELKKYKDNDWFPAACRAGLFRDGNGNAIRPAEGVSPKEAADRMAAVNGAFYVADRDTGIFRKYGDNGEGGYTGMQYNTPPRIDRPNFVLRFLDYCGFNVPSVKAYKQQMQSVKGNPLYYKLDNVKAKELSQRFVVSSSRLPFPAKTEDEPAAQKKENVPAAEKPAEETVKAVPGEPSVPETPAQNPSAPDTAKKTPAAVSVEETDDVIKIHMADGSVQTYNKQAPEKAPEAAQDEKTAEAVQDEKAVAENDKDAIDRKIAELTRQEKDFPESSPMGLALLDAKEALAELKEKGLPTDPAAPDYTERYHASMKAASSLLLIDQMSYIIENGTVEQAQAISLGRENSADIKKALEKNNPDYAIGRALEKAPADRMRKLLYDPAAVSRLEKAVGIEIEREERAEQLHLNAVIRDNDGANIDRKIAELTRQEKDFPESSPMGLALLDAKEALAELKEKGLPTDPASPEYAGQFAASRKVASALLLVDEMNYLLENSSPEEAKDIALGRENSLDIKHEIQSFAPEFAVESALENEPADKIRRMLNDPGAVTRFEKAMAAEKEKFTAAEDKAAAAKKAAEEEIKKEADPDAVDIDRKILELTRKEQSVPESSPYGLALLEAKEALAELKEKGLPTDPNAPAYKEQYASVQKAAAGLLLVDQMDYLIRTQPENISRNLTVGRENSSEIKNGLRKLTTSDAIERKLYNDPAGKFRKLLNDPDAIRRFDRAVSKEMKNNPAGNLIPHGSVIHGAVYKEPGVPGWKRMPGAKEEDVKKSLDELADLPKEHRTFKKIAAAEKNAAAENSGPVLAQEYRKRMTVMRRYAEEFPENSVMRELAERSANALGELNRTGVPTDPRDPAYAEQTRALKQAVVCLSAYRKAETEMGKYGFDKSSEDFAAKADKIGKTFADNALLNSCVKNEPEEMAKELAVHGGKGLLSTLKKEQTLREEKGIPDAAERKGALYRMHPTEKWKQVPGSTLHEINDSLMTVMDEKHSSWLVSYEKAKENVHLSNASLAGLS